MIKKFLIFFIFVFLNNCTTPGSALLGPAFTGAKTGSIYQASLSYGTGKVVNRLNFSVFSSEGDNRSDTTYNTSDIDVDNKNSQILLSYKIEKVEYSELIEPEPLP